MWRFVKLEVESTLRTVCEQVLSPQLNTQLPRGHLQRRTEALRMLGDIFYSVPNPNLNQKLPPHIHTPPPSTHNNNNSNNNNKTNDNTPPTRSSPTASTPMNHSSTSSNGYTTSM